MICVLYLDTLHFLRKGVAVSISDINSWNTLKAVTSIKKYSSIAPYSTMQESRFLIEGGHSSMELVPSPWVHIPSSWEPEMPDTELVGQNKRGRKYLIIVMGYFRVFSTRRTTQKKRSQRGRPSSLPSSTSPCLWRMRLRSMWWRSGGGVQGSWNHGVEFRALEIDIVEVMGVEIKVVE